MYRQHFLLAVFTKSWETYSSQEWRTREDQRRVLKLTYGTNTHHIHAILRTRHQVRYLETTVENLALPGVPAGTTTFMRILYNTANGKKPSIQWANSRDTKVQHNTDKYNTTTTNPQNKPHITFKRTPLRTLGTAPGTPQPTACRHLSPCVPRKRATTCARSQWPNIWA